MNHQAEDGTRAPTKAPQHPHLPIKGAVPCFEITLDPDILRKMGPQVAVVHAILAANDRGEGTSMTHAQVAKTAGITRITARRCIDKLRDSGLLKSEPQFQDNWRQANLYQIPTCVRPAEGEQTHDHSEQTPAHIEQANSTYATTPTSPSSSSEEETQEVDYPYPGVAREGLRPSGVNTTSKDPSGEPEPRREVPSHPHRWTPPGAPMPVASRQSGPWRNLLDTYDQAYWLVMHFEGHVLPRMNQERKLHGWKTTDSVGEKRRERWLSSAITLLSSHPLEEVVEVTDWLFSSCHGYLPASVVDDESRKRDRKVTRIQQVADYYEELADMALGNQPPKSSERLINWGTLAKHQSTANYGEPFEDPGLECKVTELVSLFTHFRTTCGDQSVTDFRTWGWAKTFRIMLVRHSYEDIKAAIVAITACRDRVDVSRYSDAFHLKQEWHQVLSVIELHKVMQDAGAQRTEDQDNFQESPPPELSFLFDEGGNDF